MASLGAALLTWSPPAAADGLALNRFDPAPAGDRMFGVQSPFTAGHLTPHVMLLVDYAHNPLVLRTTSDDSSLGSIVSDQLFLHANASLALFERLTLNVDVPVALFQAGDDPAGGGARFVSPSDVQMSDLRLGARVSILGGYHDAFQLALGGYVWVPTGPSGSFVGDGLVRGTPQLIVGGRTDRVVWSAAAGPEFRGTQTYGNVEQGLMVKMGGGVGFLLDDARHFQLGPEVNVAITTADVSKHSTNAEAMLDGRYRVIDDVELGLGAGVGLTSGVGTPDFRGVFMVAYTPEQKQKEAPPSDRDGDGVLDAVDACPDVAGAPSDDPKKNGCPPDRDGDAILDAVDACPDVPGPANDDPTKNGCPPPGDRDGDGVVDEVDACPDVPGAPSDDPKKNGCPPDRDEDGVPDATDACPDVKGVPTSDPATNGCPPDTDGDGITDDKDACPNEKGKPNADPEKNGCPEAVRVTESEIVILQQVQFDVNKSTIKRASDGLLDEVAGALRDHPEITAIEVQGHTDSTGSAVLNRKLSQARADAVVKALIDRGIVKDRLVAKGYGPDVPIDTNQTEAGRQKNRRVQFKITAKAPKGGDNAK